MCLFLGGKGTQVPIWVPTNDMDRKVIGTFREIYETHAFENQYHESITQDICKVYNKKPSPS